MLQTWIYSWCVIIPLFHCKIQHKTRIFHGTPWITVILLKKGRFLPHINSSIRKKLTKYPENGWLYSLKRLTVFYWVCWHFPEKVDAWRRICFPLGTTFFILIKYILFYLKLLWILWLECRKTIYLCAPN